MLWFNSPCTDTYNKEFAPINRKNTVIVLELFQL